MVIALSCLAPCGHTLHCARFRCHRTSGGSSLRAMVSTVKSGLQALRGEGVVAQEGLRALPGTGRADLPAGAVHRQALCIRGNICSSSLWPSAT